MRSEVPREWVIEVAKYLEIDENTIKAILIDAYGVYAQSYVYDENGLMVFNGENPSIITHGVPVVPEVID